LVNLPLYQTEAVRILAVLDHKKAGVSTNVWLRILPNRTLDLGLATHPCAEQASLAEGEVQKSQGE
jgi:hypothetical protein